jgi:ABC-type uncharacterized transport system permease subunit
MAGSFLSLACTQPVCGEHDGRTWLDFHHRVALCLRASGSGLFHITLLWPVRSALELHPSAAIELNLPPDLVLALPQVATIAALVLVALRIRAAELVKRRNFVAQFGQEIKNLKNTVIASGD